MEIADCVEDQRGTAIEVLVDRSGLTVDPPIGAHLTDAGTAATITVTNGGRDTVRVGQVAIGGRHPDAFSLASDQCGRLAPDASCSIVVSYDRRTKGNPDHHAVLKIPTDDRLAPQLSVSLLGGASGGSATEQGVRSLGSTLNAGGPADGGRQIRTCRRAADLAPCLYSPADSRRGLDSWPRTLKGP